MTEHGTAAHDQGSSGARAALYLYAIIGALSLAWATMIDDLPTLVRVSHFVMYFVGLFLVHWIGRRRHGALLAWLTAAALIAAFIAGTYTS